MVKGIEGGGEVQHDHEKGCHFVHKAEQSRCCDWACMLTVEALLADVEQYVGIVVHRRSFPKVWLGTGD